VDATDALQLRPGPDHAETGLLEAWRGDRRIAAFVESGTPERTTVVLVGRQAPMDPTEICALLDALTAHVPTGLELATADPLVRDVARRYGSAGPLRGALVPTSTGPPAWTDGPAGVHHAVQQLLPDIVVDLESNANPARVLLRRVVSGVSKSFTLYARPEEQEPPTRFSVPYRDDLLIESLARCIDTTIAIRRRFGRVASTARRVSWDHSDFQLLHGNNAGSADRSSGLIHMNASLVSVEGLMAMEAQRAERGGGGSASVPGPFNQIDGTTAHEMWHQMEGAVEGRRAMTGIELRRRLGEALGVETLEQAVNGGRPRSPDSWKIAHARLVTEVSPYGATAPVEATAEMFKLWWCATSEPTPIVRRFAELVQPILDAYPG
jgi:hypothetical protein